MKPIRMAVIAAAMFGCTAAGYAGDASGKIFYAQGSGGKKIVALTFDDGPGRCTPVILDILKRHGVKATFFMEGSQVEYRPALAREVAAAGHEIGNHTYSHVNYYACKKDGREKLLEKEMDKAAAAIEKATGTAPRLLRVPNGYVRSWVKDVARRKRYMVINWTFGCDWKKMPGDQLLAVYIKNLQPGAILLMHDGGGNRQRTADMLGKLIEEGVRQGYRFVTVSELLNPEPRTVATVQVPEEKK